MRLKTSGETMQSLNNASRRCAHVSAIFSPPGCALPKLGAGREAIVFTTRYVMQRGATEGQTVGLWTSVNSRFIFGDGATLKTLWANSLVCQALCGSWE